MTADDYDRLYAGADTLPVVRALKAASSAPRAITDHIPYLTWRDSSVPASTSPPVLAHLLHDYRVTADEVERQYTAHFGPHIGFRAADAEVPMGHALVGHACLDEPGGDDLDLTDGADEALSAAAAAYSRECRWDFAPGLAGMWLLYLVPFAATGTPAEHMHFTAHLAGFAIAYDRDGDGAHEALAHMWVAQHVRRHGVADHLLREARQRLPLTHVEGPLTDSGQALIAACWPSAGNVPPA